MKLVQVVAGAGEMYCGACTRDVSLARAMADRGHDVTVWPLYTPLRLEHDLDLPQSPLAFGGINAYLREVWTGAERLPQAIKNWLDSPGMLAFAGKFAVRTRASDLGPMTVSVLKGIHGKHAKATTELARLIAATNPDAVLLPNTLLSGLAPALKQVGSFPVLCEAQGEDGFLAELPDAHRTQAIEQIRQNLESVDRIIVPCLDHKEAIRFVLGLPDEKFVVVPPTTALCAETPLAPTLPLKKGQSPKIGCLSSIRKAKGQDLLVAATAHVSGSPIVDMAGKVLEPEFQQYLKRASIGRNDIHFIGEIEPAAKCDFFAQHDLIVIPSRLRESRGIVALEALAYGRPVVAPKTGIFIEFAKHCDGIQLFEQENPQELGHAISEALIKPYGDFASQINATYNLKRTGHAFGQILHELLHT